MAFLTLFCVWPNSAFAQSVQFPEKPAKHVFVVDQANLLSPSDLEEVNKIAQTILVKERTPIYVVTINSLEDFGATSMSISLYAKLLFDDWGIGYENHNYGMLLLVSKSDRRIRMELGKDWAGTRDQDARYLVDRVILPRFKSGNFSEGIVEGVRGMDGMARDLALPSPNYEWWVMPTLATIAFLAFGVSISMFMSGKNGAGWLLLMISLSILGFIVRVIFSSSASNSHGFGGGFSGGGGASGGW